MGLSSDQTAALEAVARWAKSSKQTFVLGGLAGTGKTTLLPSIVKLLRRPRVCAPTGKAASILRGKGLQDAGTIHQLIYVPAEACADCGEWLEVCKQNNTRRRSQRKPPCPRRGVVVRYGRVPSIDADFVVVDEASMVTDKMHRDLLSFGKKILFVGDHGQLQPVGRDPGIMESPDHRLEHIHRQAAGSPIIQLAHAMRRGDGPDRWCSSEGVTLARGVPEDIGRFDVVICAFNQTRVAVNRRVRALRGFRSRAPAPPDRIISLRNNADAGLFNGMLGTVTDVKDGPPRLSFVDDLGNQFTDVPFAPGQFGALQTLKDAPRELGLFDFGYALTAHKAQGSEWNDVCVLEQLTRLWDPARWRYTAVSRSRSSVTYCLPA